MVKRMFDVLLIIVLFLIVFSLIGLLISIRPPRIHSNVHPGHFRLSYEDITLKTSDGLLLKGWFIPRPKSDQVIVALHGYPADKGNILPAVYFLNEDFNLLLFDFRYFGKSGGFITTAGAREVKDLLAALEYLKSRGFQEIGVWGFSLGGAVALMTAGRSRDIRAVVSDSAYAELSLMAQETYRHLFILKYPLALLTGIWSKLLLGVDIQKTSPARQIQKNHLPVLLIHSTRDAVIPFSHALRLKEALSDNPRAEFWFREGLTHGELGEGYERRIRTFFNQNL